MSTVPRLPSAVESRPAEFRTVLAHNPAVLAAFWDLYSALWSSPVVDDPTREVVRLRNARVTDCGYCRNVRFTRARDEGLDESTAELVCDVWDESDLSVRHKAALLVADRFLAAEGPPPEGWPSGLSRAEIVELCLSLALFVGFSKVLITLGLEPEAMDTTLVPTPGST